MAGLGWDRGEVVEAVRRYLATDARYMGLSDRLGLADEIVDIIEGVLVCQHSARIRAGLRRRQGSRQRGGRPRAFSESDCAELASEAALGKTRAELALEWGVSPWTIAKYLRALA